MLISLLDSILQCFEGSHVSELDVLNESVSGLCQLGLHEACPRVHKLTLSCDGSVTTDHVKMACSSFHHITELHVKEFMKIASISDPTSFCDTVISSCPRLVNLSFWHVRLGNHVAAEIIRGMMAHSSLESIT